jgi:hypothetical protein
VSSTSARPTNSSRKFVPEDGVAADVASDSPRDAQEPRNRSGRASLRGGATRVTARRACVWRRTTCASLTAVAGAESVGVEVTAGVETRGVVGGALTVVEAAAEPCAIGAGSGRIEG